VNRERLRIGIAFLVMAVASLAAVHWRVFEAADNAVLDEGFRLLRERAPQPVARDVVLVGIDENTFRQLREPFALWHPHLGRFLKAIAAAKPSVVGLDIVLPDKSYDFLVPGYDRPLLEGLAALRGAVPVVLAQSLDEHGNQRQLFPPYLSLVGTDALGSVAVCRDADGTIRRFDETRCGELDGEATLAGRMAAKLGIEQRWSGYIDYAAGDAVGYVPFHQVLAWIDAGDTARIEAAFGGKPVILGVILPFSDRHPLPVSLAAFEPDSRYLPGVLIHVQALRSMMQRGFVQALPSPVQWLLAVLAAGFWFGRSGVGKAAVTALAVVAAFSGFVLLLFWKGLYLPGATLSLLVLCAFGARLAYDARHQIRERRFLRDAFGSYVSPQILKEILRGRIRPGIAGRRERICVMFCDIRGFTTRAENLSPEEVIGLLNDYFSAVTAAIYRHGGTTNKFLGDGLLAFFGAPQALANAEKSALEAAQDMLAALEPVNARLEASGKAPIRAGIGLHSGEVVLGHVGGESHQEYTAIGDVVNIASRLDGLTKEVGYPIVCSEPVAAAVGRSGGLVDLGVRPVRGHAPLHVFGWQPPLFGQPSAAAPQSAPRPA
jgi:adenylate cyclase